MVFIANTPDQFARWHLGQKCVPRWPTKLREIAVPERRQGSWVRWL